MNSRDFGPIHSEVDDHVSGCDQFGFLTIVGFSKLIISVGTVLDTFSKITNLNDVCAVRDVGLFEEYEV